MSLTDAPRNATSGGPRWTTRDGLRLAGRSWHSATVPGVYFDERIAEGDDAAATDMFEPAVVDPAVSFLADLAGDGGAPELGLGPGRSPLPLSQRGGRGHRVRL